MTATAPAPTTAPITQPDFASPQFKANPYPFYARLRAEAPLYPMTLPNKQPAWLVTRYEDALAVLKDEQFAKDPRNAAPEGVAMKTPWVPPMFKPLTRNMLDVDAPDHTRLRALVHQAFTPRFVERLRDRVQTLAGEYLDAASRKGSLDLIADFALPLPVTVIADMLGVPERDRHKFQRWSQQIVSVSSRGETLRILPSVWAFVRYLRGLFRLKRAEPGDDLTTALLRVEEAGDRLSEDELLAMVFLLLVAGHETTVNLIASGTLALLQHPEQADRLRREPAHIKTAVEELLRYTSPVDIATERYSREAITLHGTTIPQGGLVLIALGAANRDASQFPEPDALDLTREPNRHLAFGHGSHYCLGAPLARLEGQIAITTLLDRYPDLRLAAGPQSLRWRRSLFLRGMERLPLAY